MLTPSTFHPTKSWVLKKGLNICWTWDLHLKALTNQECLCWCPPSTGIVAACDVKFTKLPTKETHANLSRSSLMQNSSKNIIGVQGNHHPQGHPQQIHWKVEHASYGDPESLESKWCCKEFLPNFLQTDLLFVPGKACNSMPPELFCCCGWHSSASAQLRALRSSQRAFSTATKMISPMAISSVGATAFSPWAGYVCWDVFIAGILDPLVMLMITEWDGCGTVAGGCSLPKITLPLAPEHWSVHVISVLD